MRLFVVVAIIVLLALPTQKAEAGIISAQFAGTISTIGASPEYGNEETDNLGLFGGGSLVGDPVTITYSIDTDYLFDQGRSIFSYTEDYEDVSYPPRIDGTLTIQLNGHTFQTPVVDVAEVLASGLSYGSGADFYDAFGLGVPGGYNVNVGHNGLEVQVSSTVVSYIDKFLPNYLDPTPPGFSFNSAQSIPAAPFDPNEIEMSNSSAVDLFYYDVTSVSVTGGEPSSVPEPPSWFLMIASLGAVSGMVRRTLFVKRTL